MGPGAIAFTLMPRSIRWVARPFVNVVIAPCKHPMIESDLVRLSHMSVNSVHCNFV